VSRFVSNSRSDSTNTFWRSIVCCIYLW